MADAPCARAARARTRLRSTTITAQARFGGCCAPGATIACLARRAMTPPGFARQPITSKSSFLARYLERRSVYRSRSPRGASDIPIAPGFAHFGVDLANTYKPLVLCPAHGERRPSCSVNTEKGVFFCFACDAKGTALNLIMLIEGIDRGAAVAKAEGILRASGHKLPAAASRGYHRPGVPDQSGHQPRRGKYVPPGRRTAAPGRA